MRDAFCGYFKKCWYSLWRASDPIQRLISLFNAPEIWCLLAVFGLTYIGSCWLHAFGWWSGYCALFSLDKDLVAIWPRICSGALFFIVWLIGGGVLVSVMVAQQRRNSNGEFRFWTKTLRRHVVFLGWDENVPALMIEEQKERGNRLFIIVTMHSVDEVVKAVVAAGIEKWQLVVYRGFYDDDNERKRLNLKKSAAVYVVGEKDDESHDSRVVLLAKNLRPFLHGSGVLIHANILDFGLANKFIGDAHGSSLDGVVVDNFHLKSAESVLKRVLGTYKCTRLAVIGFGAMGKAIVVQGLSHGLLEGTAIYITDDEAGKLAMERGRFDGQFSELKGRVTGCGYKDFLEKLSNDEKENWLVIVAKRRSEKGWLCVWDVLANINKKSCVRLALNQEVKCDIWADVQTDQNHFDINGSRIELFGFKHGDLNISE